MSTATTNKFNLTELNSNFTNSAKLKGEFGIHIKDIYYFIGELKYMMKNSFRNRYSNNTDQSDINSDILKIKPYYKKIIVELKIQDLLSDFTSNNLMKLQDIQQPYLIFQSSDTNVSIDNLQQFNLSIKFYQSNDDVDDVDLDNVDLSMYEILLQDELNYSDISSEIQNNYEFINPDNHKKIFLIQEFIDYNLDLRIPVGINLTYIDMKNIFEEFNIQKLFKNDFNTSVLSDIYFKINNITTVYKALNHSFYDYQYFSTFLKSIEFQDYRYTFSHEFYKDINDYKGKTISSQDVFKYFIFLKTILDEFNSQEYFKTDTDDNESKQGYISISNINDVKNKIILLKIQNVDNANNDNFWTFVFQQNYYEVN